MTTLTYIKETNGWRYHYFANGEEISIHDYYKLEWENQIEAKKRPQRVLS